MVFCQLGWGSEVLEKLKSPEGVMQCLQTPSGATMPILCKGGRVRENSGVQHSLLFTATVSHQKGVFSPLASSSFRAWAGVSEVTKRGLELTVRVSPWGDLGYRPP